MEVGAEKVHLQECAVIETAGQEPFIAINLGKM